MIKEVTDKESWNNFLLSFNPNTFLQSWEWGQVQQADGEDVRYLGIFENDEQAGAALTITVNARRGRHLLIPHGPVFKSDELARKFLPELIEYLKHPGGVDEVDSSGVAKRGSVVGLRIAPLLESTPKNIKAFQELGFKKAPMHVHAELTWVLDIDKPEEDLLSGMRKTTRHAIKKAQQVGVHVEVLTDATGLDRFYSLYEQTKTRHQFVPYSKELLATQLRYMNAYTIIATHQGQDLASAICFQFGKTIFYYHGASIPSKIPAAQLLQWQSIKYAKSLGATLYNFWGIAPDDKPNHPFAGITVFKKGFGGRPVNYIPAQDQPLSPMYYKLWAIEHYRRVNRGF